MEQFKIGDWVKTKAGFIKQISCLTGDKCDTLSIGNTSVGINVVFKNEIELWKPRKGEWCWFHNGISSSLVFAMFYNSNSFGYWIDEDECDVITNSVFYTYKYCEPFTGNLPTIILN